MSRTLWINTGETSGDLHGGLLCRALAQQAPDITLVGMGGESCRAAGMDTVFDIRSLSVMGFTEVLGKLPTILGLLKDIKRELAARKPDAVVLIDAPSFNFRIARAAHELGIPVLYYISPKVWAWNTGRVKFLRRHVRRVLSILPFEVDFYRRHGMEVDYVGNPLVDAIAAELPGAVGANAAPATPQQGLVGILPGSRAKEISSLVPVFGEAARLLRDRFQGDGAPDITFELVRAPSVSEERLRELWPEDVPVTVLPPENRYAAMRRWQTCFAASGTVTLETALLDVPTVVAYRLSALTFAMAKRVVKVKYVSLPNLILDDAVFPELLQSDANPRAIATAAARWLADPAQALAVKNRLADLRTLLGDPGAPERAAGIILASL